MTTCDRRQLQRVACFALLALSVTVGRHASAQQDHPAAAKPLFDQARQLMGAGRYEEACPKLEVASGLYAGSGILLNLGDCYEHTNRTASAWREFGEAAHAAALAGRTEDEAEAKSRQSLLEPRLAHVSLHIPNVTPGLVITSDDRTVERALWSKPIAIDAGPHNWVASANGYQSWSTKTAPVEPGATLTVEIPELPAAGPAKSTTTTAIGSDHPAFNESVAAPPPPVAIPVPDGEPNSTSWGTQRTIGVVSGGAGILGLGVGGVLALVAKGQYNTAAGESGAARHNDSLSAVNSGNVATAVMAVGGALVATGVVLWLTAPSATTAVGFNGSGVTFVGQFQ